VAAAQALALAVSQFWEKSSRDKSAALDTPATIKVSKALPEKRPSISGRFAFQASLLRNARTMDAP
jgi:hypothetical protein